MEEEKRKQEIADAEKRGAEQAAAALKADLQKKEDELAATKKDLEGLKDKDFNFGKLTKQKEEAEKALEEAKAKLADAEKKPVEDAIKNNLEVLGGSNKELKDKIEFHFKKLGSDAKSPDQVAEAMKQAYLLATGSSVPKDVAKSIQGSGGGNNKPAPVSGTDNIDPNVKSFRDNMNRHISDPKMKITDEDLKKYPLKPGQDKEIMN